MEVETFLVKDNLLLFHVQYLQASAGLVIHLVMSVSQNLRGSHLNSPLPLPRQVQLIMWPFSAWRSHFSPMR